MLRLAPLLVVLAACRRDSPAANPEFTDAAQFLFQEYEGDEVDLAFAMRTIDAEIDAEMDLDSANTADRSLELAPLTDDAIADITHPDADPALALPVAVARRSTHPIDDHAKIPLLADQTPVEPYSPNHYDRTFLDGTDACWPTHDCETLRTWNDLTKENFLMTVDYTMPKDYRWIDLNLPDPADVADGEDPVDTGTPRWAILTRTWLEQSFEGDSGKTVLVQSYTVETWIPRDDGAVKMMAVWAQTTLTPQPSDDTIVKTTRAGIDSIYETADEWLDEQQ